MNDWWETCYIFPFGTKMIFRFLIFLPTLEKSLRMEYSFSTVFRRKLDSINNKILEIIIWFSKFETNKMRLHKTLCTIIIIELPNKQNS